MDGNLGMVKVWELGCGWEGLERMGCEVWCLKNRAVWWCGRDDDVWLLCFTLLGRVVCGMVRGEGGGL